MPYSRGTISSGITLLSMQSSMLGTREKGGKGVLLRFGEYVVENVLQKENTQGCYAFVLVLQWSHQEAQLGQWPPDILIKITLFYYSLLPF